MHLREFVEAGDVVGALRALGAMTHKQRSSHAADLEARLKAMGDCWTTDWGSDEAIAVSMAGLACQVTPKAAAAWLLNSREKAWDCNWAVDAVNLYPAEWRAELVAQLGKRAKYVSGELHEEARRVWFGLAEHLIYDTGCPVPTSDAFIEAWLDLHPSDRRRTSARTMGGAQILGGVETDGRSRHLRGDGFTPILVPSALERPGIGHLPSSGELADLIADGIIDHARVIRGIFARMGDAWSCNMIEALVCNFADEDWFARERAGLVEPPIARLLQDGTRMELRAPLAALRALAPTADDNAAFLRDHVAMLDLSLPVAAYGQEVLIELDEAGLLEADVLTEACERVLLRPEKKLVRAQLSWLDRVARREPARAGRVLADVAMVFQHPDTALQERALNLVARRLPSAGEEALPQLRDAAASLSPGHSARAAELLGLSQDAGAEQYAEVLPEVPGPRPVPGPLETAVEVAQQVAAVLAGSEDMVAFERALDGLVRHARLDWHALSAALAPAMSKEPRRALDWVPADLYEVAAAVRGVEPSDLRSRLLRAAQTGSRSLPGSSAGEMLMVRLSEAIQVIESGTQPFLLAVPTLDTGAIDAAVLVERIAEYEERGIAPAPTDLAQALLRVDPAPGGPVRRAAEELGSEAGRRLAQWLRDGGLAHQDSTPQEWPVSEPASAPLGRWRPARPGPVPESPLPAVAAALVGPDGRGYPEPRSGPFWAAQLPHHSDEAVARNADALSPVLPFIAQFCDPAGFAVHWAVARSMDDSRFDGSRNAGVDALLMLAARGRLDRRLLGGQLQAFACLANDVTAATSALRAAAETGAYATVWSVIEPALPGLLGGKPVRGAGALLALAVECASRCGAKGPIAAVEEVAGRKGSTQTIKNARLLRDVLG